MAIATAREHLQQFRLSFNFFFFASNFGNTFEPMHKKTNNPHMQKQRHRSAVQLLHS